MRFLSLILALAWLPGQASAAACNTTSRLNGFDAPGACTGTSEVTGPVMASNHPLAATAAGGVAGFTFNPEGDQFGLHPEPSATLRAESLTQQFRHGAARHDTELRGLILHERCHEVGDDDHPHEQVAVAGATGEVRGNVAGVHVRYRGDESGAEQHPRATSGYARLKFRHTETLP